MIKGGLGEVRDQVKDEEAAEGILQSDLGTRGERFIPQEEVTQQWGILGVLPLFLFLTTCARL